MNQKEITGTVSLIREIQDKLDSLLNRVRSCCNHQWLIHEPTGQGAFRHKACMRCGFVWWPREPDGTYHEDDLPKKAKE